MTFFQKLFGPKPPTLSYFPFWMMVLNFLVLWIMTLGTVFVAIPIRTPLNGLIAGCVAICQFFTCTVCIWQWVRVERTKRESMEERLAALTTELAELKHSKPQ